MISDKLTVIIPTYNRYEKLLRLLTYVDSIKSSCLFVILDSSDNREPVKTKLFRDLISKNNVSHVVYDPSINPMRKIADGLKNIKTPYAVLWADDDLMIPGAFEEAVFFLETHRAYSMVNGISILFSVTPGESDTPIITIGPYLQRGISDDLPSQRLRNHLDSYSTTFYSVHRTKNLKKNIELCNDTDFVYHFGELTSSCLAVIQGKLHTMQRLYMIREAHQNINSWRDKKINDFFDLVVGSNFSKNYEYFREYVARELVSYEHISVEKARDIAKQAFWSYLGTGMVKKYNSTYVRPKRNSRIKNRLKQFPFLWRNSKNIWEFVKIIRTNLFPSTVLSLNSLLQSRSKYHTDFIPAYNIINKFSTRRLDI
ncbi:MAG: TIGR00180 family glycosyltransferase [bacterium]